MKILSLESNSKRNKDKMLSAKIYSTHIMHKGKILFIIICFIYIIKYVRNNSYRSDNYFSHPKYRLSNSTVLKVGKCDIKLLKKLCYLNNKSLLKSIKIIRTMAYPSNLDKQKVKLAIHIFSKEVTDPLI